MDKRRWFKKYFRSWFDPGISHFVESWNKRNIGFVSQISQNVVEGWKPSISPTVPECPRAGPIFQRRLPTASLTCDFWALPRHFRKSFHRRSLTSGAAVTCKLGGRMMNHWISLNNSHIHFVSSPLLTQSMSLNRHVLTAYSRAYEVVQVPALWRNTTDWQTGPCKRLRAASNNLWIYA